MNMDSFKKDIDELIGEFAKNELTTLADMKRVWLDRKFSYIYEATPSTNQAFFMQSLFARSIDYMVGNDSLSHRLGGLYCLYCLYEVQPHNPPFRVYISLGQLKKLKVLVVDAKAKGINVVPALVKKMLNRNTFLFGAVDLSECSAVETVNQLQEVQNARIQIANEKLFNNTPIESHINMDLGMTIDLDSLKKMSSEYAAAKDLAIGEASKVIDVEDIEHISKGKEPIGDVVQKIADDWNAQKQAFYKQTGLDENEGYDRELEQLLLDHNEDDDDDDESDEE
ncbi:hypothetical protein TanjilG_13281 [Lupinus angustifolius]|uniref:Small nuclear RNA activating complex (SNAPc), subunit SNAP43 n=1 Tax=Lupinus angustifolius TaxID=3871 RepID=A0A4P1RU88_LUPAN|nr:PREDICTED: uncharacterized protein LOC109353893 [Lupinus angustifolius]XP_019451805.1 PREDICTED: uncharacterized protein LOC109353893 [Lupinus angustifolius]OIW18529.1 hypothetical protein TanjilG_13281 [Lupinus angustifolius]